MVVIQHLARGFSIATPIVFERFQCRAVPFQSSKSDSVGLTKWK